MTALPSEPEDGPALPYRLVVPSGWTRLPSEPHRLRPAVQQLLLRRFAHQPRDRTAALRREIEQHLVDVVSGPGGEYLRKLLLLDLQVERRPVSATCLVSLLPHRVSGEAGLQELAATQADGTVLESVVEDLGSNRGVVVVRDVRAPVPDTSDERVLAVARAHAAWTVSGDEREPDVGASPEPVPDEVLARQRTTRSVDVLLPVPDGPRVLLLSFSTPVEPLFEPLTTLFLTIASTVQWQRDGRDWS